MVFLTVGFARETAEERLDLKSFKGQTKAEELGTPCPELLSLRLPLKAFQPLVEYPAFSIAGLLPGISQSATPSPRNGPHIDA